MRSGDINDDESSCLVLNMNLPANSGITFAARTSSEGTADHLRIILGVPLIAGSQVLLPQVLDAISADAGSSERDWTYQTSYTPHNISRLSFCYFKDSASNAGADRVWIDSLSFSISDITHQNRICAALDLTDQSCAMIESVDTDRSYLWAITTETSVQGGSSLRSTGIFNSLFGTGNNCYSIFLRQPLPGPTRIHYSRRISAEINRTRLLFAANGSPVRIDSFSAESTVLRDWEQGQFVVSDNLSSMIWCYVKDSTNTVGADSIWIDALSFVTADLQPLCDTLDLPQGQCATIRSTTYDPPQNPWRTTTTAFFEGDSALVSPPLETGQSACLTLDIDGTPPAGSYLTFAWRVTSASDLDILEFRAGSQPRQLLNMPQWQTEIIPLNGSESTLRWCYSLNSPAGGQTARAWLDSLLTVSPDDRYAVQITVTEAPVILSPVPDRFRFQVTVTAQSPLLPTPTDWVLRTSGIDNIASAITTHALVFSDNSARVDVIAGRIDPFLSSTIRLELDDRPLLRGVSVTSLTVQLPPRQLDVLDIVAPDTVTQASPDAAIEIAVTVNALDNLGLAIEPEGLILMVGASDSASVPQSSYALTFMDGASQTTITVELTVRGMPGIVGMSVITGDITSTASVTINPTPRVLTSVSLSATNSSLAQTMANTAVMAELILTALDNYGDPIEAGNITLLLSGSGGATGQSSLIVPIEAGGSAQQMIEILPQNDLVTTVTVQLSRGNLDEAVQLLPEGGVQIAVRALGVLHQLQLSLADRVSPLQQINASVPIRARVQLIGLDQFDQPIAFTTVTLTATADPSTTQVTLDPQQVAATAPEGAMTVLEVMFSETPLDTTITIAVTSSGTEVTAEDLVLRALPDRSPSLPSFSVDNADSSITALDLIVALRWLADQQGSTQSLVANLAIDSARITAAGIDNLQQLFTEPDNLNRVDLNRDGSADQLDLRILLRWLSGLRGAELAEQEVVEDIVRRLLGKPPTTP